MRVFTSLFCLAGLSLAFTVALQPALCLQTNPPAGKTEAGKADDGKTAPKPPAPAGQVIRPGKDRWPVKTATDPDARSINPKPEKTSVESLLDLPRPVDLPLRESNPTMQEHRARPVETTVYSVEVDVTDCRLMPDGDYRVTLRGASGKTIVMEMPDTAPDFVDPTAPFVKPMREARIAFANKFTPEKTLKPVVGHARITGIGYFGRAYGDKPVEGNLIQLHPVLKVEWLAKPTTEFAKEAAKEAAKPKPADTPDKATKP